MFKQFILNWLASAKMDRNIGQMVGGHSISSQEVCVKDSGSSSLDSRFMNFKVFSGLGGIAVEIYYYDQKRDDRRITKLYILPDGCELGEELARIISLESMNFQ